MTTWPDRALARTYPLLWLAEPEGPFLEEVGLGLGCVKTKGNRQFSLALCPGTIVLPRERDPIRRRWEPHGLAPAEPARVPPEAALELLGREWRPGRLDSRYRLGGAEVRQSTVAFATGAHARIEAPVRLPKFSLHGASAGAAKLWREADGLVICETGPIARPLQYRIRLSPAPDAIILAGVTGDPAILALAEEAATWEFVWNSPVSAVEIQVEFTRAATLRAAGKFPSFAARATASASGWRDYYMDDVPRFATGEARVDALGDHLAAVYRGNVMSLGGLLNHPFTMAKQTFQGSWVWDSCFHAIGGQWFGRRDWAWGHLLNFENLAYPRGHPGAGVLTNSAQPHGVDAFISSDPRAQRATVMPHLLAGTAGEGTHPPHLAQALLALWETDGDERLLRRVLPEAVALDAWFERRQASARLPGLLVVRRWSDSGMDNSKRWGAEGSGIYGTDLAASGWKLPVVAVEVNVCSVLEKRALATLCAHVGDAAATARYSAEADARSALIHSRLWDVDRAHYADRAEDTAGFVPVRAPSAFYPLLLDDFPVARLGAVQAEIFDPRKFWTPFPLPSLAADDPDFRPNHSYWMGCTWMSYTVAVARGLLRHDTAAGWRLLDRVIGMLFQDGAPAIYENFNPLDGTGYDAANFGWHGMLIDVVVRDLLGLRPTPEGLVAGACRAPAAWGRWEISALPCRGRRYRARGEWREDAWHITIDSP